MNQDEHYGIPQGGALSTLIANVVLNVVDECVEQSINGQNIVYLRFCDDMILVGEDKDSVTNTFRVYAQAIKESQLFAHSSSENKVPPYKKFWDGKTRETYKWGDPAIDNSANPWVTFVGFDCNWNGNLRIRRPTLKKHIKKQYRVVMDLLDKPNTTLRCHHDSTLGYIENKLIAMSVGNINRHNYLHNSHVHSWMKAFIILDENKWTKWQMRHLDMCRMRTIHKARKLIADKPEGDETNSIDRDIEIGAFHGKMYSYYGQCFTYR